MKKYTNFISIIIGYAVLIGVVAISTKQMKNCELFSNPFFNIAGMLVFMLISVIFHIIFHEFGHLVCGIISGYQFISFRVGNIVIIKDEDRITVKRFYIPGMPGQCLMSPPTLTNNTYPCTLYLLGGGLFNLIATVLADFVTYVFFSDTKISMCIIFIFGSSGIFFFVMNLFPMNIGSIMNDGYVLFLENNKGKLANYYLLKINRYSSQEKSFSSFPSTFLSEIFNFDYSNIDSPCIANLYLYAGQLYSFGLNFEAAKKCYERISVSKSVEILRSMSKCELIFLDILQNGEKAEPDKYIDINTKSLMDKMKNDLSILRVKYALTLLYQKDFDKAMMIRNMFMKRINNYPTKVESDYELTMVRVMEKKYEVKI